MKVALEWLGDLWEETQYEEVYNMKSFLAAVYPTNTAKRSEDKKLDAQKMKNLEKESV